MTKGVAVQMFTRILVALDGSVRAERALPAAAHIARATDGKVILATVVSLPNRFAYGAYDPVGPDLMDREYSDAEAYLRLVHELPALTGIAVETTVLMGTPVPALLEEIAARKVDLVVLTSRGRTGSARWLVGSVTQQLVRSCEVPMLVLRDQGPALAARQADLEHLLRVLVSLDGGSWAETSLDPAAHLALAMSESNQAGLHLTLVVPPSETTPANMSDSLSLEDAKLYLAQVSRRLKETYPTLTVTWSVGVGVDIAMTITRIAESGEDVEGAGVFGGCDVIALTTHGRTGTVRLALGTVAERIVHTSRLPVLILHPPAGGEKTT
jgi:nucleotide-binding universal stress UspA family protein